MIEFTCPSCASVLRVGEEHSGKRARCPNCQAVNTIVQNAHPNTHATPVPPTKVPIEPAAAVENPFAADANPFASPASQPSANYYSNSYGAPVAAHRGGLILGLGIAAIVCNMFFVPGILAWILGRADLKEIRAGRMDRMGESTTQAGMIMVRHDMHPNPGNRCLYRFCHIFAYCGFAGCGGWGLIERLKSDVF